MRDFLKKQLEREDLPKDERENIECYLDHYNYLCDNIHTVTFSEYLDLREMMSGALYAYSYKTGDYFLMSYWGIESIISKRFPLPYKNYRSSLFKRFKKK